MNIPYGDVLPTWNDTAAPQTWHGRSISSNR
jgi:hypothetical protein